MTPRIETGPAHRLPLPPRSTPPFQAFPMMLRSTTVTRPAIARRALAGGVAALAALAALAGCADAPLTTPERGLRPSAEPRREIVSPHVTASVLTRVTPLSSGYKAVAIIGPTGGRVTLPQTGLTLTVPPGAVRRLTTFTVSAPAGAGVWYDFGPSGATFDVPLTVTQDLRNTHIAALAPRAGQPLLEAGYYANGSVNLLTGSALVKEFIPITLNETRTQATFSVRHFSGYMVSTGRSLPLSDD